MHLHFFTGRVHYLYYDQDMALQLKMKTMACLFNFSHGLSSQKIMLPKGHRWFK